MRTTLTLPDDVYAVARSLALARGSSLGDAVAELVRQGLAAGRAREPESDSCFPRFSVPADAAPITLEQTLGAEDDEI